MFHFVFWMILKLSNIICLHFPAWYYWLPEISLEGQIEHCLISSHIACDHLFRHWMVTWTCFGSSGYLFKMCYLIQIMGQLFKTSCPELHTCTCTVDAQISPFSITGIQGCQRTCLHSIIDLLHKELPPVPVLDTPILTHLCYQVK